MENKKTDRPKILYMRRRCFHFTKKDFRNIFDKNKISTLGKLILHYIKVNMECWYSMVIILYVRTHFVYCRNTFGDHFAG